MNFGLYRERSEVILKSILKSIAQNVTGKQAGQQTAEAQVVGGQSEWRAGGLGEWRMAVRAGRSGRSSLGLA